MMTFKKFYLKLKKNKFCLLISVLYLILATVFALKYYHYQINPDGTSYISIAKKYLQGDFKNAINAYWGPLYSWFMLPFLFIGIDSLLAVKVVSILTGLLTLYGLNLYIDQYITIKNIKNAVLLTLVPILFLFSFFFITPDFLLLCLLIFYLYNLFKNSYAEKTYNGLICGFIGALSYLAKSYSFFFFLGHFPMINLLYFFGNKNKEKKLKIFYNFIFGILAFAIISGSWIYLISIKYQKITFGTAGQYNLTFIGPGSLGHPMQYQGFIKPPNKTAVNAWEDPSFFNLKYWNPLGSIDSIMYEIYNVRSNINKLPFEFQSFSLFSLTIIFIYLILCLKEFNWTNFRLNNIYYPVLTIFLYSLGYAFVCIDTRYLWLAYILLLLMGGHLIELIFVKSLFRCSNDKTSKIRVFKQYLCLFILCLSFIQPFVITYLIRSAQSGKSLYKLSQKLKEKYHLQGKMASNKNWDTSLYLAYYLGNQYYGEAKKNLNPRGLTKELKKYQIDYYLFWEDENRSLSPLSGYTEITKGKITGLEIYQLK